MKTSSMDQAEGKFHKMKGKLNGVAGVITDDVEREIKGKAENIKGRVQEKIGQIKKVFGK